MQDLQSGARDVREQLDAQCGALRQELADRDAQMGQRLTDLTSQMDTLQTSVADTTLPDQSLIQDLSETMKLLQADMVTATQKRDHEAQQLQSRLQMQNDLRV